MNSKKGEYNELLFHGALKAAGARIRSVSDIPVRKSYRNGKKELHIDIAVSSTTFPAGWVASDKVLTKILLKRANIPVANGSYFRLSQEAEMIEYAKKLDFPCVLKPAVGQHGDCVYSNIMNIEHLSMHLRTMKRRFSLNSYVIIEQFIPGNEYRIFATKHGDIACVHRIPAEVTGDGKQSIMKLIQTENFRRMHPRNTCLCEIKFDDVMFSYLESEGRTIDSIPKKGERITLRKSTNVSMGGWCSEITPVIHKTVKNLARNVLDAVPGLSVVGIDLICEDITKSMDTQKYIVCELNASPGLSLHVVPPEGNPVDVPKYLVGLSFPRPPAGEAGRRESRI